MKFRKGIFTPHSGQQAILFLGMRNEIVGFKSYAKDNLTLFACTCRKH